ncbi:MAG: hypothetical protein GON13_01805 [Nanoarchaeota archaeon]|nr:hypothetical protein [Nanoarchaeota archaeon]
MDLNSILPGVLSAFGLGTIFFWIEKIFALITIWWFGGKFSSRFASKLNKSTTIVLRVIIGIAIYFLGIIVGTRFLSFLPNSISDIAGAGLVFTVFYITISMLTRSVDFKIVMREEFQELVNKVDKLESLLNRVFEASTDKKILSEKLKPKDAESALKRVMLEFKKIKDYVVLNSKTEKDNIFFDVKCKLRSFQVVLDAYTGKLVKISHLRDTPKNLVISVGSYVYENKSETLGAFLLILFVNYVLVLNTPAVEQRLINLFSFSPPETNDSFSFEDLAGEMGMIPQGVNINPDDLQDLLSQMQVGQ